MGLNGGGLAATAAPAAAPRISVLFWLPLLLTLGTWTWRRVHHEAPWVAPQGTVCSHRATLTAGAPAPLTMAALESNLRRLAAAGVACFDLDMSPAAVKGGKAGDAVIGHPDEVRAALSAGTLALADAARPAGLFKALAALPRQAVVTLELKGELRDHAAAKKRLAEAAQAAGVADRVFVLGAPLASLPAGLPKAAALRDVVTDDGVHCGLPPEHQSRGATIAAAAAQQAAAAAFATIHAGYDVLLPSVLCMRDLHVQAGLAAWAERRRAAASGAGKSGKGGKGKKAAAAAAAAPAPAIFVWVVDGPGVAAEVLEELAPEGVAVRLISNQPGVLSPTIAAGLQNKRI